MSEDPIEYFKQSVDKWEGFVGFPFGAEDKNLRAFANRDSFRDWFAQTPGAVGEPYRDEGFYTRELTFASMRKPKSIVEIGTSYGIGTLILSILNPEASITTVDDGSIVPDWQAGWIAAANGSKAKFIVEDSQKWKWEHADMYFIDGNHSFEVVLSDSRNALTAANPGAIIMWHDYNDRHTGVMDAVNLFCARNKLSLQSVQGSSTVWCIFPQ